VVDDSRITIMSFRGDSRLGLVDDNILHLSQLTNVYKISLNIILDILRFLSVSIQLLRGKAY